MQYEPIKDFLGRFLKRSLFMRKAFYFLLDTLLLRTWHVRKALRSLARQLPKKAKVLDAGSGFGQYSWRMSRMNRGWSIDAVDINQVQIEDCSNFFQKAGLGPRVKFSMADLTKLSTVSAYDLVLSVDVMEHIEEDVLVFKNFYSSLREGGRLLISTPSDQGGSDAHSDEEESFIDEHVRNGYSVAEITHKLESAGFRNIKTGYTYGKPGNISWRLSMKYPVKMLNTSYLFFLILPFYYVIFFPFCLILNFMDLSFKNNKGTGLLVTAEKTRN